MANLREALNCGTPQPVTGQGQAGELQLYEVDQAKFPDAVCNDGTPPILYYRPYRGAENRNRWVISLRGGGGCGSAAGCAARWCSCDTTNRCPFASETTNFNLNNMSGGGRRGQPGGGVMLRSTAVSNPLENYNHAQFIYCSSDAWSGAARGVTYTTTHPITGQSVTYTLHFMGTKVLDADLSVLRRDGVAALSYTLDGAPARELPDLDEAEEVVMVGDSAGGSGVIHNLDYVRGLLRAQHVGGGGGPEVVGIIDAVIGPELRPLDFSHWVGADAGITTWEGYLAAASRGVAATTGRSDESCKAFHAGDAGVCVDTTHLVRHHVTTPFFVRMALFDQLVSNNYLENGTADPVLGPFTRLDSGVPATFARVLQRELGAFPALPSTAEEGAEMAVAPGVFAPTCAKHDTIHDDAEVYGVSITPDGGAQTHRFFDVFGRWRDGGTPSAVLSADPTHADTVCP